MLQQEELDRQNPWWENKQAINQDPKIEAFNKSSFKYIPDFISEMNMDAFAVHIVRGPRQIGKTVALKLIIRDLLQKAKSADAVFYFDCESLLDFSSLKELLEQYFHYLTVRSVKERSYVFLDEITSVENWPKIIKFLSDRGLFQNSSVFLSGSNALDLKRGGERLPGRRGQGKDINFLPINFRSYLKNAAPALFADLTDFKFNLNSFNPANWHKQAGQIIHLKRKIEHYFSFYLFSGGYPYLINEFLESKQISFAAYELYLNWLKGDIAKAKIDDKKGMFLLGEIANSLNSKLGFDTLAKKISNISYHTIEHYVNLMESLYILKILYHSDLGGHSLNFRKAKKIYFLDSLPYFLSLAFKKRWANYFSEVNKFLFAPEQKSGLIEQIVFNHLCYFEKDWFLPNLSYWSNHGEIDFIWLSGDDFLPIEVKYQNKVGMRDFKAMAGHDFKSGLILSHNDLMLESNFLILPTSIFLSLLGD